MLINYKVWEDGDHFQEPQYFVTNSAINAVLMFMKQNHKNCHFGHIVDINVYDSGPGFNTRKYRVTHKIMSTFDIDPIPGLS